MPGVTALPRAGVSSCSQGQNRPSGRALPFTGLAVSFVRQAGARVMLRGLRTTTDMENEFTMSLMNHNLDPEIETVFLMAKESYSHLSSSMLRQIATFGGNLTNFVPPDIRDALIKRVRERGEEQT